MIELDIFTQGCDVMDDYWAKAELEREQAALFYPTLDEMIGHDHPVRLFDEILGQLD